MTRELQGLEEGSKAEIHIDLLKKTLKKYQTGKRQAKTEYMVSGSRNSPPFTHRLALEMNRCLQRAHVPDQRKDHIDPKGPKQTKCPKMRQNHNPPTDDVENINSTNKGRDLPLANNQWIVPWGTERMPQRILRHSRVCLHRSAHP